MNDTMKNILLWVVIALILVVVFSNFGPKDAGGGVQKMPTSTFLEKVKSPS